MEYFSLTVADVDTELTCPAQADVTRDNRLVHFTTLKYFTELFRNISESFLPPSLSMFLSLLSPPQLGRPQNVLEINPEKTNGDLNTSYVKIAIVMSQY